MKPEPRSAASSAGEGKVRRTLIEGASLLRVPLTADDVEAMLAHFRSMMKWRRRADLTSLVDPREIGVRHYLDSLTLAPYVPRGVRLADLGSGAGFPGIPLAIARPDLDVTLLETREVKLAFLHHAVTVVRRQNLHVARTTDLAEKGQAHRFGWIVARAVADSAETLERCAGLLTVDGQVWLMRGPSRAGEPQGAAHSRFRFLGELEVELPFERAPRRIVMYQRQIA